MTGNFGLDEKNQNKQVTKPQESLNTNATPDSSNGSTGQLAYQSSLLGNHKLSQQGNLGARADVMLGAQQTHGNRGIQRFVHSNAKGGIATPVHRSHATSPQVNIQRSSVYAGELPLTSLAGAAQEMDIAGGGGEWGGFSELVRGLEGGEGGPSSFSSEGDALVGGEAGGGGGLGDLLGSGPIGNVLGVAGSVAGNMLGGVGEMLGFGGSSGGDRMMPEESAGNIF